MRYRFVLHSDLCCACSSCQIACIDQNDLDPVRGESSFRKALSLESMDGNGTVDYYYGSVSCLHCEDAACINACPKHCIVRDPHTGFVICNNAGCIGCKLCYQACPYHIPQFRPSDGRMVKCNGCNERVKRGLQPDCVKACPFSALECVCEEAYEDEPDAQRALLHRLRPETP